MLTPEEIEELAEYYDNTDTSDLIELSTWDDEIKEIPNA
ncbi:hypothetical protein PBI_GRAYSON_227 [Rhodococcus phage Grayson]|nr:hypothetical protein PBI_GRAYSON_227 [Rhodococcus phage Grayson]